MWCALLVAFVAACGGSDVACEPVRRTACCNLAARPPGIEPAMCCADGTWRPNPGDSSPSACDAHDGLCPICGE